MTEENSPPPPKTNLVAKAQKFGRSVEEKTRLSPCHKRGILAEIPAFGLFVLSAVWISANQFSHIGHTTEFTTSLMPEGIRSDNLGALWWWFNGALILSVFVVLIRLYVSFSVFDHDRDECATWIWPLRRCGRYAEVIIRMSLVIYLVVQVHASVAHSIHPYAVDVSNYFPSLNSEETIRAAMEEAVNGPVKSAQRSRPEFLFRAAGELHKLSQAISVMIEIMLISLLWDIVLLWRKRGSNKIIWRWTKRFLLAHVSALIFFLLALFSVSRFAAGDPYVFLLMFIGMCAFSLIWIFLSVLIGVTWLRYLLVRLRFYFSPNGNCHIVVP